VSDDPNDRETCIRVFRRDSANEAPYIVQVKILSSHGRQNDPNLVQTITDVLAGKEQA
jgi:hypothetical protein